MHIEEIAYKTCNIYPCACCLCSVIQVRARLP